MNQVQRTELFLVIRQRVVVILIDVSEQTLGPIFRSRESKRKASFEFPNAEKGTDRLFYNISNKLPLLAA
jgi:hypothetical protein